MVKCNIPVETVCILCALFFEVLAEVSYGEKEDVNLAVAAAKVKHFVNSIYDILRIYCGTDRTDRTRNLSRTDSTIHIIRANLKHSKRYDIESGKVLLPLM